ncbi:Transmembrane protein 87B [Toxocara canis]|uniref:Transmembrane protein 87B n=1 Tax=Toxocara canis TaxID=6265 RepID=A0A0B2UUF6_TOXCA|nr:Transmembrane protein 87B [Toxocara canis]
MVPFSVCVLFVLIYGVDAHLLTPAILSTVLELKPETAGFFKVSIEYVGFPQSALNGTEVEIRLTCADVSDLQFDVQFVIRSSPCDKEFFDVSRQTQVKDLLNFYFEQEYEIPEGYDYKKILFYKSNVQRFNCKDAQGTMLFNEQLPRIPLEVHSVTTHSAKPNLSEAAHNVRLTKREFAGLNGDSLDGGAKTSLSSWHPVQKLPMDGIYFLVLKFTVVKFPSDEKRSHNITMDVQWRGPYGYLSAIDYPLLRFYAFMCIFYTILALVWLAVCLRHWKDILRIQFWIGAVIIVGMIEKAMFYSEYETMNNNGVSVDGFIEAAELISCLKRTISRVLIIIVSVGYGVVKPRLGSTLNQVAGVGFIYFIFCAIEGLARVSKAAELISCLKRTISRVLIIIVSVGYGVVKPRLGSTLNQVAGVGFIYFIFCAIEGLARVSKGHAEALKQKQLAALPLIIIEVIIFWWIFTSLISTMRVLRLRRNEIKLSVYRHFTNTLCFAVIASGVFMVWTLYMHNLQHCLVDWKEYWVDTAFWHVLFCAILVVIMILWRPSQNNQRYAFTPLLDDSEDENDEDELFNSGFYAAQMLNQRGGSETRAENRRQKEAEQIDQKIKEDLKWIDDNIPSSIADKLLVDDEEDKEQTELERSKML